VRRADSVDGEPPITVYDALGRFGIEFTNGRRAGREVDGDEGALTFSPRTAARTRGSLSP